MGMNASSSGTQLSRGGGTQRSPAPPWTRTSNTGPCPGARAAARRSHCSPVSDTPAAWTRDPHSPRTSEPRASAPTSKILAGYDLALVQEVRDPDLSAVSALMEQINSVSEHEYSFVSSQPLGRDQYKEMYLFVYRKDEVSVVDTYLYPDPEDVFSREPFVVKFSAPSSAAQKLVLIPLHAAPHQAVAEIDALYDVYLDVIDKWGTDDLLFLGDFNADCSYVREQDWAAIRLRSSEVFKWLIPDSADTTVGKSDCAYDRIVACGARLRRSLKPQSATVHNFQEEFGLDQTQALAISDHFPVEVTLKSHR
ncbi:deoxyribonuclease-1-like 2 isoform X3 [Hylobates moloch]|uniref:deoxyribonuclease-1-like 2 isoform X3 n=1 Tax=Hylobates moloch TaxID=81572 RepID=UPI001363826B|nr:deoxyribonuclease-1-like 2 isoform X3 [Hylobates moloch]